MNSSSINIPGYKIEKLIAEGGMASVYLALQESLARPVVLKLLRKFDNPSQASRFFNEGRIIASLEHRNIITIFDLGVVDERHYLAMEYLQGGDLRARIDAGIAPEAALDLVETLGSCLSFVHQKGIIHRDIKPENILFRQDGSVVLTDFGVAKQMESNNSLTMDGTTLGSPHYLSPEQAQCKALDGRADIYSLGIICYEMLTGLKPFQGESPVDIIVAHLTSQPPPLPSRLNYCQPLLARMIALNPEDRFASAAELVEFVQHLRTNLPKQKHKPASTRHKTTNRPSPQALPQRKIVNVRTSNLKAKFYEIVVAGMAVGVVILLTTLFLWPPVSETAHDPVPEIKASLPPARMAETVSTPATAPTFDSNSLQIDSPPPESQITPLPTPAPEPSTPIKKTVLGAKEALRQADEILKEPHLTIPRLNQAYDLYQLTLKKDPHNPSALSGTSSIANKFIEIQIEIERYLNLANAAIKNNRLSPPQKKNAADYYRQILTLEPGREDALKGITKIADLYADRVEAHLRLAESAEAERNLHLGLSVQTEHPRLKALAANLNVVADSKATQSLP